MTTDESDNGISVDDIAFFMAWHMDSQRRIYDVLLSLLASGGHGDKAKQLQVMHDEGKFLYPPFGHDDTTTDSAATGSATTDSAS